MDRYLHVLAARVHCTTWDIGNVPIKCLSVHTATIQKIRSFSLLHCTDTVYTVVVYENILFMLRLLGPGGGECILRDPFNMPENPTYTYYSIRRQLQALFYEPHIYTRLEDSKT